MELTAQVGARAGPAVMIPTATLAGNNAYSTVLALYSFKDIFDNPLLSVPPGEIRFPGELMASFEGVTINKYANPRLC